MPRLLAARDDDALLSDNGSATAEAPLAAAAAPAVAEADGVEGVLLMAAPAAARSDADGSVALEPQLQPVPRSAAVHAAGSASGRGGMPDALVLSCRDSGASGNTATSSPGAGRALPHRCLMICSFAAQHWARLAVQRTSSKDLMRLLIEQEENPLCT